jgi:hypothetical protein
VQEKLRPSVFVECEDARGVLQGPQDHSNENLQLRIHRQEIVLIVALKIPELQFGGPAAHDARSDWAAVVDDTVRLPRHLALSWEGEQA